MLLSRIIILTLAVAGAAHAQGAGSATGPTLSIQLRGIAAQPGPIMVGVFDEASWKGETPIRGEMLKATNGQAQTVIAGLPAGRYGIKVFQDVNGNGKLDKNLFGMPTEPFAFSNNAKASGGPATWADASFAVKPGQNVQAITFR